MDICTIEDGSATDQTFPCLWDAAAQGNGIGQSFVLDEPSGVPHYVTEIAPDGTIYTAADVVPEPVEAPVVTEVGTVADVSGPAVLASTGMDPIGALTAAGLVVIGALLVVIRRLTH